MTYGLLAKIGIFVIAFVLGYFYGYWVRGMVEEDKCSKEY